MRAQNDPNRTTLRSGGIPRQRDRRRRTGAAIIAVGAAWAMAVTGVLPAQAADPPVDEPAAVEQFRTQLGRVAEEVIGEFGAVGPFGERLPLEDALPGAPVVTPALALALPIVMDELATRIAADAQTAPTLDVFVGQLDSAYDGPVDDADPALEGIVLDLAASALPEADGAEGFALTISVTRTVDVQLAVEDPSGPGGKPLRLATASDAPAPYRVAFDFAAEYRVDPGDGRFWLVPDEDAPEAVLHADLAGDDAFEFPGGEAAIGIADVEILDGSTIEVDANWSSDLADSNDDGRLALEEPASDGGPAVPGELGTPVDQLAEFSRAGSATAGIDFGSSLLGLSGSPAPALELDVDLATDDPLEATLTGTDSDLEALEMATRLGPGDLVSGLVQYGNVLRTMQLSAEVDRALPMAGGRLSDLVNAGDPFFELAEQLIVIDPAKPVGEQIVIGIATVGDLADELAELDGIGDAPEIAFDRAGASLRIAVEAHRAMPGATAPLDVADDSSVAQFAAGDQLRSSTRMRGVTHAGAAADPAVATGFDLDLPIVIDLSEATAVPDDPETDAVVEFESPMVYERFGAEVGDDAELALTQRVDVPIAAKGSIGFVPVKVGGTYSLTPDGSAPTTVADVDASGGATSTPRLKELASAIGKASGSYVVQPNTPSGRLHVELAVTAPGVTAAGAWDETTALTDVAGEYTVEASAFANSFTASIDNDAGRLLTAADVDPLDAVVSESLRGRTIDAMDQAVAALTTLSSSEIPVLGLGASELLDRIYDLDALVDDVRDAGTAGDIRALERTFEAALADVGGELELRLRDLGGGDAGLDVRLTAGGSRSVVLPLTLNDPGDPSVGTDGGPEATLSGELDLGAVVPLTAAPSAPKLLADSAATVRAKIGTEGDGTAKFGVRAGPVSVTLGDGANGFLALGAQFAIADPTASGDDPVDLAAWAAAATAEFGSTNPGDDFTCQVPGGATITGEFGCVAMPVMVGPAGAPVGIGSGAATPTAEDYLTAEIDGTSPSFELPTGLTDLVDTAPFSFDSLGDGLASIGRILDIAITASNVGSELPGIGEDLGKFAKGLAEVRDFLESPVPGLTGADVDAVVFGTNGLRDQLLAGFGPAGLGVLVDSDYAALAGFPGTTGDPAGTTTPDATDIRIVPICGGAVCSGSAPLTDLTDVTVEMELGEGDPDAASCAAAACVDGELVDLGFGLDGLPLSLDAQIQARAGWRFELGFGISRDDGFYLIDNPVPADNTANSWESDDDATVPQEIRVHASAEMPANGTITGVLGFLAFEAENTSTTGVDVKAQLGLQAGTSCSLPAAYTEGVSGAYCWNRVRLTTLLSGGVSDVLTAPRVSGGANAHLALNTGVAATVNGRDYSAVNASLPSIVADFTLEWTFTEAAIGDPVISLDNIGVAPGEMFTRLFGGVLKTLDPVLEPIQPVRDFLFSPIPVLSDVSELFGGDPVTMADLAETFGDVDLSLLKDIDELLSFVQSAQQLGAGTPIRILDHVSISGDAAQGPPRSPDQVAGELVGTVEPPAGKTLEEAGAALGDGMKDSIDDEAGYEAVTDPADDDFSFPVFDDPSCIVTLMLGSDCEVAVWRPDALSVHMPYEANFGPFFGVLYITIAGEVNASAHFGAGISTRGVRLLGEQVVAGGIPADMIGAIGDTFAQSLFLTDVDGAGKDIAEFEVKGSIKAGAKLSVLIAEFSVNGGIEATFGLNLNDTPQADGRMYFDELWEKLQNPVCLFDFEGNLAAFLEVAVQVGWPPLGWEDSWELARIVLLDFSLSCDGKQKPPNLASYDGSVVVLNVGALAGLRGVEPGETDEQYVVRQLTEEPDGAGKFLFELTAFGATEKYLGSSIRLASANGADSFTFLGAGNGAAPGSLNDLPEGEDAPDGTWPFVAPVSGSLGTERDTYRGGDGPDTMNGDDGCDAAGTGEAHGDDIDLGGGENTACGGPGDDRIVGGPGHDVISGGDGVDSLDGGLGGDTLNGDAGADRIMGGTETTDAADGDDVISGGPGADAIVAGSGADRVYGDEAYADTDVANGTRAPGPGAGADAIEGGPGSDWLFGGAENDAIHGGMRIADQDDDDSADHIQGDDGADALFGGAGADDLWGGRHADRADGGVGDDRIDGQSGDDPELRGGQDRDLVWGGEGSDALFGDAGDDELVGDGRADSGAAPATGADRADGGSGRDLVLGDNGMVSGAVGARIAHPSETVGSADPALGGGDDDDRVYGEGGADLVTGGGGRDLLHGNGGADTVQGETGDDEAWGDGDADLVQGGPGKDVLYGNAGADTVDGQEGIDLVIGGHYGLASPDAGDRVTGGPEADRLYGDDVSIDPGMNGVDALDAVTFSPSSDASTYGADTGDGGPGQDELHGQDAADTLYGADDYDQLFGELAGDRLVGGAGPDDLVGDQGTIAPEARHVEPPAGGWDARSPNGSPDTEIELVAPTIGGDDLIWGDFDTVDAPWSSGGDDRGFGGHGTDTLRGGPHDDHLEGNGGQDRIFGFDEDSDHVSDGADDLIGGSSPVNPLADPEGADNALDEGEVEMQGNGADDVMTGDNAVLTRRADPDDPGSWQTDPVTGGVFREVTLLDTDKTGADLDAVSGGDFMLGNDENDRMFGEGGNDLVQGNAHDDLVEGDQDADWLEGNGDEDDLIGGSSFPDQPDSGDVLWGGGGADVVAGDNACIVRDVPGVEFDPSSCPALDDPAPAEFHYVTSQLGVETRRGLVYHDLDGPFPSEFGRDILNGGSGVDVEFGQDGGDALFGDGGADVQHGNGGADIVIGDRPVASYGGIALPLEVGGVLPALPAMPGGLPGAPSTGAELVGPPQADGQDDQFGGSNLQGMRDTGDWLFGDGEADFQLGDNGELNRTIEGDGGDAAYAVYEERYPGNEAPDDGSAVIEREVTRYDVGASAAAGVWGADFIFGGNGTNPLISAGAGDGDDSQWGQDGDDRMFGEDGADDQFGELGDDTMWGGAGEDAMVGDRGGVQTRFVEADGSDAGDPDILTHTSQGPPGINLGGPDSGAQDAVLHPFEAHPLYRGTSLTHDRDGSVLVKNGHDAGGADRMRGGPGHDSMHGGEGADLMNGDSGGDYAYGDDGADVMWGGRGDPAVGTPDLPGRNAPGEDGQWIDVLFAGYGASATEAGADIVDYQPRPGVDHTSWFTMVQAYADTAPENTGAPGRTETRQHHHGTDWQYGGWDRDVLQADVSANGPNDGDKLLDWGGAYNLYTACNSAYGGWNDVRKIDPNNVEGLEKLAYVTGARADFDGAPTLGDVQAAGSAAREAAIVYTKDLKNNTGKAFSGTPGHFESFICTGD